MIAKLRINALIATLATLQIVRGLALIASNGRAVGINDPGFYAIAQTALLGVPAPIWIMLVCLAAFGFTLNRTVFGRNVLAIGGNPDATRLAGVDVVGTRIWIFALQGVMCGIAGVLLASRITSGQPNAATGLELSVISACVLGGVSLAGWPSGDLGRRRRGPDPRHRRERHEPPQHPGLLSIPRARRDPAAGRDARQPPKSLPPTIVKDKLSGIALRSVARPRASTASARDTIPTPPSIGSCGGRPGRPSPRRGHRLAGHVSLDSRVIRGGVEPCAW